MSHNSCFHSCYKDYHCDFFFQITDETKQNFFLSFFAKHTFFPLLLFFGFWF